MQIILAEPRGFCAGVERAIDIVELALKKYGPPVYVRHEIVHNKRVVENLKSKGVKFVEEIEEIPRGAIAIFSAHGVSRKVETDAKEHELLTIDATCPLVSKVHREGQRYSAKGIEVIMIGHENHPEVEGTLGQIPGKIHLVSEVDDVGNLEIEDPNKVAFVTQTTLSVDDTKEIIASLRRKFPKIQGPDIKDICYATQNRQSAVRTLAKQVDMILVVGASNSSNSNRLCEVGNDNGTPSYLISNTEQIQSHWFDGIQSIGITAGASTPEELVQEVIEYMRANNESVSVEKMNGITENVRFSLPKQLRHFAEATVH